MGWVQPPLLMIERDRKLYYGINVANKFNHNGINIAIVTVYIIFIIIKKKKSKINNIFTFLNNIPNLILVTAVFFLLRLVILYLSQIYDFLY